jgi:hypothetical protein
VIGPRNVVSGTPIAEGSIARGVLVPNDAAFSS